MKSYPILVELLISFPLPVLLLHTRSLLSHLPDPLLANVYRSKLSVLSLSLTASVTLFMVSTFLISPYTLKLLVP